MLISTQLLRLVAVKNLVPCVRVSPCAAAIITAALGEGFASVSSSALFMAQQPYKCTVYPLAVFEGYPGSRGKPCLRLGVAASVSFDAKGLAAVKAQQRWLCRSLAACVGAPAPTWFVQLSPCCQHTYCWERALPSLGLPSHTKSVLSSPQHSTLRR